MLLNELSLLLNPAYCKMDKKRKTYFIYTTFCPNHAADNRALAYLRSMSAHGYQATVIFLLPDTYYSKIEDELPGITVEYFWDTNSYIKTKGFNLLSYVKYLFQLYRKIKPGDIVYLYGGIDILMMLSHKKGVHIFHERTEHPLTHPAQGLVFRYSLKKYLDVCKQIDGLFVISTTLRDYFIESGVPEKRITIVNSIVDLSRFHGLTKQETEPYFAYCGNGNNKKDRVDVLIRCFETIASNEPNVKLYIIGPTKQCFSDEQDNVHLVQRLGITRRVFFTGEVNAERIPQLLVNAKALFLTRPDTLQNRAGFSTKLSEYLASGTPVVAASVGDIPRFLKDKENALLYKPGEDASIVECMNYILNHPVESKIIGERGRECAKQYFNAMIETRKLIEAFNRIS